MADDDAEPGEKTSPPGDFSWEEMEVLRIRSALIILTRRVLATRKLTQLEWAKIMGVGRPKISDVLRGRIDLFSVELLVKMLARAGVRVDLTLKPTKRKARPRANEDDDLL